MLAKRKLYSLCSRFFISITSQKIKPGGTTNSPTFPYLTHKPARLLQEIERQ